MRPATQRKLAAWLAEHQNTWTCECGCGGYITPTVFHFNHRSWYRPRFIPKHQNRGVNHTGKIGVVVAKGYIWLRRPRHPLANPRGYVKRCWIVAERKLGRLLREDELVHHKDGNKLNDAPSNLAVLAWHDHRKHHGVWSMNPRFRHDIDVERDILPLVHQGWKQKDIAVHLNCTVKTVRHRINAYSAAHKAA